MSLMRFKKRFSLAAKFNILTIALILATSAGICLFMLRLEITNYYQELLNHGKTIAETTARNCEFGIYTESQASLLPVLGGLSTDSDIAYVSVTNQQRHVLASRVFRGAGGLPKGVLPIDVNAGGIVHRDLVDEQDGKQYLEIISPIVSVADMKDVLFVGNPASHERTVIGHLRLGLTQEGLQKRIHQLIISATLFTSLLALVGTGLMVLLSRRITSPLKRLTAAAQEVSEGKFDSLIDVRTNDEIADLAGSFDHMQGRLREYRAQVEERIAKEQRHLLEKEKMLMDLHDGIGGITTNISILSELAQTATELESVKKTLATISLLSREGVSEIRSFMQSLDTKELSWAALAAELRSLGAALVKPHHMRFSAEISVEDVPEELGSLLWMNLFRIYKEALTNIIKHSHAKSVMVLLHITERGLLLTIQDDGIGRGDNGSVGRGLPNMKKRAVEVGGRVAVSADKGTRVVLELPFPVTYAIPGAEP